MLARGLATISRSLAGNSDSLTRAAHSLARASQAHVNNWQQIAKKSRRRASFISYIIRDPRNKVTTCRTDTGERLPIVLRDVHHADKLSDLFTPASKCVFDSIKGVVLVSACGSARAGFRFAPASSVFLRRWPKCVIVNSAVVGKGDFAISPDRMASVPAYIAGTD